MVVQADSTMGLTRNVVQLVTHSYRRIKVNIYEGWNFNSGKYLFTTDTK